MHSTRAPDSAPDSVRDPVAALAARVVRLERQAAAYRRGTTGAALLAGGALLSAFQRHPATPPQPTRQAAPAVAESLVVRQLVVVDGNGTVRARVGAPVPDGVILGKPVPRGGGASGVILYDADGNERGGYVTDDGYGNVLFTLDDVGEQRTLFLAEPQGDVAFHLYGARGGAFKASAWGDSAALRLEVAGKTVQRLPAPSEAPASPSQVAPASGRP